MSFALLASYVKGMTPSQVEALLGRGHVVRRSQQYVSENRVGEIWADGSALRGAVSGTSSSPYLAVFRLHDGALDIQCSCPYAHGTCWHAGAVLMTLLADPERLDRLVEQAGAEPAAAGETGAPPAAVPTLEELENTGPVPSAPAERSARERFAERLLAWPKVLLADSLAEFAERDPLLRARLLERREEPTDLDLRLYRHAARSALRPGATIRRFEVPRVAADLREITGAVARLVTGGHPEAALELLEEIAYLAWQRLEEVDDRDGALAALVHEVLGEWCRGWAEVPSRDRMQLARSVFGWLMEDQGRLTSGLIVAARDALGPAGLESLASLLRPALDARRNDGVEDEARAADPQAERLRAALRELAEARGDLDEFLRHCDAEGGHGASVLAAAERLAREGQLEEALRWAQRGERRARGTVRGRLGELRIALLARLGRRREAIDAAWEEFLAEPGATSYRRLIGAIGDEDRGEWRRRALDHAESGSDATAFVEVAIAAGDAERLTHRLLNSPGFVLGASPGTLERATGLLAARHPGAAARIFLHLAGRLLAAGDPRDYGRAREALERAQESFDAAGTPGEWQTALERVRDAHAVVRGWFG